ncbi:MAG: hypothetical protein AAF928_05890 [Myxococcota bacterium]
MTPLNRVRAFAVVALVATGPACEAETTRAQQVLLEASSLGPERGGPPKGEPRQPVRRVVVPARIATTAAGPIVLDVHLDVVATQTGQYLDRVELRAIEPGDATITAGFLGGATPTNLGSRERFLASFPLMVTWARTEGCRRQSGTTMITLRADGTVDVN